MSFDETKCALLVQRGEQLLSLRVPQRWRLWGRSGRRRVAQIIEMDAWLNQLNAEYKLQARDTLRYHTLCMWCMARLDDQVHVAQCMWHSA